MEDMNSRIKRRDAVAERNAAIKVRLSALLLWIVVIQFGLRQLIAISLGNV